MKPTLATVSLVVICAAPAFGQAMYSVTDLGPALSTVYLSYQVNGSSADALNNNGQVVGNLQLASDGWLYGGGIVTRFGGYTEACAINNNGQVAGSIGINYQGSRKPFLYTAGVMQVLSGLGTGSGSDWAYGINDSGQVVGQSATAAGLLHAFLYSGGVTSDLGTFGGKNSIAYAINNNGQVVGSANTGGDHAAHAFLYSGGTMMDLGTLGGNDSVAYAMNNNGQIAGMAYTTAGAYHAFLYSGGVMSDLNAQGGLGGDGSTARAINNAGQVVGEAITANNATHAFLYCGSTMTDLNSLIDPNSGWVLTRATDINDNGQITGTGIDPDGHTVPFLLTPAPEPSALALSAIGTAALLVFRRRS